MKGSGIKRLTHNAATASAPCPLTTTIPLWALGCVPSTPLGRPAGDLQCGDFTPGRTWLPPLLFLAQLQASPGPPCCHGHWHVVSGDKLQVFRPDRKVVDTAYPIDYDTPLDTQPLGWGRCHVEWHLPFGVLPSSEDEWLSAATSRCRLGSRAFWALERFLGSATVL